MKPRAIVFTLYGDYLRYCGAGEARLGALTELLGLFGVESGAARVVMNRLRNDGWFDTVKDGREVRYLLSDKGWRLMNEGRERIFVHPETPWSGEWTMVISRFAESDRVAREAARKQLSWLGYGQLTPSTWMSPHDRLNQVFEFFEALPVVTLDLLTSRSQGLEHDRSIADRCWDLESLNGTYRDFIQTFGSRRESLLTGKDALVQRVRLTDSYRLFPFRDPDLPATLLPKDWSGDAAHALFADVHQGLAEEAERTVEEIVGLPVLRENVTIT